MIKYLPHTLDRGIANEPKNEEFYPFREGFIILLELFVPFKV